MVDGFFELKVANSGVPVNPTKEYENASFTGEGSAFNSPVRRPLVSPTVADK
jgi:hypothetical protein